MVDVFYSKYFHGEERPREDLLEYIKRFRDIALDYHNHYEEKTLVEICMDNMIM